MVPLRYILRSLGRRKLRTAMTVLGVALVVAIYSAMSAVADTMVHSFRSTGAPSEVVVLQAGAMTVDFSNVPRGTLSYVQTLDGVGQGAEGQPLVSPELCLVTVARASGEDRDLSLRGVTPRAHEVYEQVELISGSWPEPGRRATIGTAVAAKLGLSQGDTVAFEGAEWVVAGVLSSQGRVYDQEIWVDLDDLAAAAQRSRVYTSYVARAASPQAAASLVEAVNAGRRHALRAQLASDFYARTGGMSIWMAKLGQLIALIIALGAAFGGMNTMYSAVAGRRREIGVLRALGFSRFAVLVAILLESLTICLVGGLVGLVLGLALSTIPFDVPFLPASSVALRPSHGLWSLVLALAVGAVGGGLPALQAARMSITAAMR